jgi:DNA-binding NarL/FixJ family response regulator/anti-sigma regulatory factor (Ser/Thr protein kinase)
MYSILIVDDETSIRMMLYDYLEDKYEVLTAENAELGMRLCKERAFDMVISDVNMPGMKGPEFLSKVKKLRPATKTVLITAYNIDSYIRMAREYNITNIIPKTTPFNFLELDALVEGLLTQNIFGLSRYLLPDHVDLGAYCIRSSIEAKQVREDVTALLTEKLGTSGNMKLILDEIITNAVYHAPAFPDGTEKYPEYVEVHLQPDEFVYLECGHDSEKYGISITDHKGRLSKETVLYKIDRQIAGEGILDDSGRGIHMSRLFSDRMIINISPNNKTEIILINYFSHKYRGYKPLYINEL